MKFSNYDSANMFVNSSSLYPLSYNEDPVYLDLITKILLSELKCKWEGRSAPNMKQLHRCFGERRNIPEERTHSQVLRFNEGIAFRVELAMT
jgi:hypothetical protein